MNSLAVCVQVSYYVCAYGVYSVFRYLGFRRLCHGERNLDVHD